MTVIRHFRNEKGTGVEMHPAIVAGIVTGDVPVSYWLIFFPVPSNSPSSLCESQPDPVSFFFLQRLSRVFTHFEHVEREWVQTLGTKISYHWGVQFNQ